MHYRKLEHGLHVNTTFLGCPLCGMGQNIIICKISVACFPSLEEDSSTLLTIWRVEPPIICGDEIGHHQRSPFSFWLRDCTFGAMHPSSFLSIVGIKCRLIMKPHYDPMTQQSCIGLNILNGNFSFTLPLCHPCLAMIPRQQKNILPKLDDIFPLVTVTILPIWFFPPVETKVVHPSLSSPL